LSADLTVDSTAIDIQSDVDVLGTGLFAMTGTAKLDTGASAATVTITSADVAMSGTGHILTTSTVRMKTSRSGLSQGVGGAAGASTATWELDQTEVALISCGGILYIEGLGATSSMLDLLAANSAGLGGGMDLTVHTVGSGKVLVTAGSSVSVSVLNVYADEEVRFAAGTTVTSSVGSLTVQSLTAAIAMLPAVSLVAKTQLHLKSPTTIIGAGSVTLTADSTVAGLGDLVFDAGCDVTGAACTALSLSGTNVPVNVVVSVPSATTVITALQDVTVSGSVHAAILTILATHNDVSVSGSVLAGTGSLIVDAANDVVVGAAASVSGSDVTVHADSDCSSAGVLSVAATGTISSSVGGIALQADDMTLTAGASVSAAASQPIDVSVCAGRLMDVGGTGAPVTGNLVLTAVECRAFTSGGDLSFRSLTGAITVYALVAADTSAMSGFVTFDASSSSVSTAQNPVPIVFTTDCTVLQLRARSKNGIQVAGASTLLTTGGDLQLDGAVAGAPPSASYGLQVGASTVLSAGAVLVLQAAGSGTIQQTSPGSWLANSGIHMYVATTLLGTGSFQINADADSTSAGHEGGVLTLDRVLTVQALELVTDVTILASDVVVTGGTGGIVANSADVRLDVAPTAAATVMQLGGAVVPSYQLFDSELDAITTLGSVWLGTDKTDQVCLRFALCVVRFPTSTFAVCFATLARSLGFLDFLCCFFFVTCDWSAHF
jgi:hypothetical protein